MRAVLSVITVTTLLTFAFAQTCPTVNVGAAQILENPRSFNRSNLYTGHYVKADGEWIVAGSYGYKGHRGGALVYRFVEGTWEYHTTLLPTLQTKGAYYGLSVHVCGNIIVVGQPFYPTNGLFNNGAAEIYQFDGENWVRLQRLTAPPPDGHSSSYYGYATACHKDTIVIGARYQNQLSSSGQIIRSYTGAAYVYEYDGSQYQYQQTLRNDVGFSFWGDEVRVWVSDEPDVKSRVIVGAPRDPPNAKGSLTVHEKRPGEGYVRTQVLRKNAPGVDDHYGEGCSIYRNTIIMGGERAYNAFSGSSGRNGGNAVVYEYNDGTGVFEEVQTIEPNRKGGLRYGQRVHQAGQLICVSGFGSGEAGRLSGSAYCHVLCDDGSYQFAKKLLAPDNTAGLKFSKGIHVDEKNIYVGAPDRRNTKNKQGAIYVFPYTLS